jgi:hypothetical protein
MVGDEEEDGLGIGAAEVGVDGGEFFFLAAAAVEVLRLRTKMTWKGTMRDGVWARSRTSKMVVSARSRSWRQKSR